MKTDIVVDISRSIPCLQNSDSQVMGQNPANQSNCRIL